MPKLEFLCMHLCNRDEEKKQGTLVKEEFERPSRDNTSVSDVAEYWQKKFIYLFPVKPSIL